MDKISVPVLLTAGKYDGASPKATGYYAGLIPNAKFKIFNKSAHMPHIEETEEYLLDIKKFLNFN